MNEYSTNVAPSSSKLIKQFIAACLVAVLLLLAIVLPAEYQIDPLSTGKWLGLDVMSAQSSGLDTSPIEVKDDLSSFRLSQANSVLKNEVREIIIDGYEGIEFKATMQRGDGFTYEWRTDGGPVYTDMHGEYASNTEQFESYFKNEALMHHQGTFVAPFEGTHGWYWQNMQEQPVTVNISLSGFFSDIHIKQE